MAIAAQRFNFLDKETNVGVTDFAKVSGNKVYNTASDIFDAAAGLMTGMSTDISGLRGSLLQMQSFLSSSNLVKMIKDALNALLGTLKSLGLPDFINDILDNLFSLDEEGSKSFLGQLFGIGATWLCNNLNFLKNLALGNMLSKDVLSGLLIALLLSWLDKFCSGITRSKLPSRVIIDRLYPNNGVLVTSNNAASLFNNYYGSYLASRTSQIYPSIPDNDLILDSVLTASIASKVLSDGKVETVTLGKDGSVSTAVFNPVTNETVTTKVNSDKTVRLTKSVVNPDGSITDTITLPNGNIVYYTNGVNQDGSTYTTTIIDGVITNSVTSKDIDGNIVKTVTVGNETISQTTAVNSEGKSDVRVINPDGSTTTHTTSLRSDGSLVREITNPDGTKNTYLLNPDGILSPFTPSPENEADVNISVSEDGSVIKTITLNGSTTVQTTVINPDGSTTLIVTNPDGVSYKYLVSLSKDGTLQVTLIKPDGTSLFLNLSSDGSTTTYRSSKLNDGSVFATTVNKDGSIDELTIHPDGTTFKRTIIKNDDGTISVYITDIDGSTTEILNVTPNPTLRSRVNEQLKNTIDEFRNTIENSPISESDKKEMLSYIDNQLSMLNPCSAEYSALLEMRAIVSNASPFSKLDTDNKAKFLHLNDKLGTFSKNLVGVELTPGFSNSEIEVSLYSKLLAYQVSISKDTDIMTRSNDSGSFDDVDFSTKLPELSEEEKSYLLNNYNSLDSHRLYSLSPTTTIFLC